MANADPNDLSGLIDAAATEAKSTAKARPRKIEPQGPSRSSQVIAVVLAVLGVAAVYEAWTHYAGPSASKLATDLGTALDLARESVEGFRKTSGELPEALPNAALAAVVVYEPKGKEYRLSASAGGVRVAIERDGSKSVEKEMAK